MSINLITAAKNLFAGKPKFIYQVNMETLTLKVTGRTLDGDHMTLFATWDDRAIFDEKLESTQIAMEREISNFRLTV